MNSDVKVNHSLPLGLQEMSHPFAFVQQHKDYHTLGRVFLFQTTCTVQYSKYSRMASDWSGLSAPLLHHCGGIHPLFAQWMGFSYLQLTNWLLVAVPLGQMWFRDG